MAGVAAIAIVLAIAHQRWTRGGATTNEQQLVAAATNGESIAVAQLLERGTPPDSRDANGETALMCAARSNNPTSTIDLLRAGADPAAVDTYGMTALHIALSVDCRATARLLLEHGCDSNAVAISGAMPLGLAIIWRDEAMVDLLLQHGADPNVCWGDGTTTLALDREVGDGDGRICNRLRLAGAHEAMAGPAGRAHLIAATAHRGGGKEATF